MLRGGNEGSPHSDEHLLSLGIPRKVRTLKVMEMKKY